MARGATLPTAWMISVLIAAAAMAMSATIVGVIESIDIRGRFVVLRGGAAFSAGPGVKLSTRRIGEEVLVAYEATHVGLVALEIRPMPIALQTPARQVEQQP